MVDRPIIERKIALLKEKKATLRGYKLHRYADFLKGPYSKAVEKLLQEMVEICIDMGKHIIADEGFSIANDSREVFQILAANRVISRTMSKTMQEMVGFRNLVIHMYEKIDSQVVFNIYRRHLGGFDLFSKAVWQYTRRTS